MRLAVGEQFRRLDPDSICFHLENGDVVDAAVVAALSAVNPTSVNLE